MSIIGEPEHFVQLWSFKPKCLTARWGEDIVRVQVSRRRHTKSKAKTQVSQAGVVRRIAKEFQFISMFSQLSADLESAFHNKDFADVKVELYSMSKIDRKSSMLFSD